MVRMLIVCVAILFAGDVLAQRLRFQKYRYDPWTGRTTSVEEFDEDVRNMNSKQLQRYLNELRKVKNSLNEIRRESETLERELGFGLGGFPSLMDNSENIIGHALNSVTDQLQRRIGHHTDPKLLQNERNFEKKVKSADRSTLQRNLDRLQQTKQEITEARQRAQALKNDLGFDFDQEALGRAESAVNHGMDVINHRIQKMDRSQASTQHPQFDSANNMTNTMKKVDNALQTADQQKLSKFDSEFKKMKQYIDNVRSQLDNFHRDIGFEFDGVFEPFKMAESVLDHGLNAINRQLQGQNPTPQPQHGAQQNPSTSPSQMSHNQQNPLGGSQQQQQQQQGAQQNQQNPAGSSQQTSSTQQNVAGNSQQPQ